MKSPKIIIIKKNSLEEYLYINGLVTKVFDGKLNVIDMYPPMPKKFHFHEIYSVNNSNPLLINSWNRVHNKIQTNVGSFYLEMTGSEKKCNSIKQSHRIIYFKLVNFKETLPKETLFIKDYLIIDLRHNYGSKISYMNVYKDFFNNILKEINNKKVFIIIGHSTASSAEIMIDLLKKINNNIYLIGSESYKKEYAYKHIQKKDQLVMIPTNKIIHEITTDINFFTGDYYSFNFKNKKKYYSLPELIYLK